MLQKREFEKSIQAIEDAWLWGEIDKEEVKEDIKQARIYYENPTFEREYNQLVESLAERLDLEEEYIKKEVIQE